jgi:hypothetical protein
VVNLVDTSTNPCTLQMFDQSPLLADYDIYHSSLGGVDLAIPYYFMEFYEAGTLCTNLEYELHGQVKNL